MTLASSAHYELIRAFTKKFKEVKCPYIIKLLKVLKEDQEMHMLYEYYSSSLSTYLRDHPEVDLKRVQS